MEVNWKFAVSESDYRDWSDFVCSNPNANFLNNEHRNLSYENYGFKNRLIIGRSEGNVVAGSFVVTIKRFFVSAIISSGGVLVSPLILDKIGFVPVFKSFLIFLYSADVPSWNFFMCVMPKDDVSSLEKFKFKLGKPISIIASYTSSNCIKLFFDKEDLGDQVFQDRLLQSFTKKGRRDVRSSIRRSLSFHIVEDDEQIEKAYKLIEENATRAGYSVRSWRVFGEYILKGVANGNAYVCIAKYEGEIVGAMLLEAGGKTINYTMGAAKRLSPDLQTGYFLQYNAMIFFFFSGFDFYDISAGGPESVRKFKANFNPNFNQKMLDMYISRGFLGPILTKFLLSKMIRKTIITIIGFVKK